MVDYHGKRPKRLPVEVTEKEFCDLLDITPQMRHKVAFLLAWGSGLRVHEIVQLRREDIDLHKGQIRINQGKGKKDRIVPVPRGFKEHHLKYVPFVNGKGENVTTRSFQKVFRRYAEKCGILQKKPSIRFHSLRHGFATQCLRKGIGIRCVQMMLGHANIEQTGVYLHLAPEEALNEYQNKF